ncbi:ras association domain-containing protein 6 isoform X2 [Rhincodon typus]|uniref:ras association domain-containing protein 6 isoform X2 n=1 Tax=Rhincodon typus TaxID=259920 RepID=UPI00202F1FF6|nr:ras association domain-containing protein 6 isoform X2 [Rhincodon typus]
MNTVHRQPQIQVRKDKCISRDEFLSLLRTYNCFCQDNKNLQLTYSDNNGKVILEGVLDISWGVHQLIRFQIDDEKSTPSPIAIQIADTTMNKRGMTRWGEFDNLYNIAELEEETMPEGKEQGPIRQLVFESSTLKPKRNPEPESGNLIRTRSDASLVKMRVKDQAVTAAKKAQRQRFSINGHFYNYKIENDPNDFALYVVHANEEKKKLKVTAFPLWERLLHGPSREIVKIFLMDKDAEEISTDVAQYIKFEIPALKTLLQKLSEEEQIIIGEIKDRQHFIWKPAFLQGNCVFLGGCFSLQRLYLSGRPSHPDNDLLQPLPSGRRYGTLNACTSRYKVEKRSLIQLLHKRMMVRAETSV